MSQKPLQQMKPSSPISKWTNQLSIHFSKELPVTNKDMKRKCSTSLAIREKQLKTTLSFHIILVRTSSKRLHKTKDAGKNMRTKKTLYAVDRNIN